LLGQALHCNVVLKEKVGAEHGWQTYEPGCSTSPVAKCMAKYFDKPPSKRLVLPATT
jgi:hypothetical protein